MPKTPGECTQSPCEMHIFSSLLPGPLCALELPAKQAEGSHASPKLLASTSQVRILVSQYPTLTKALRLRCPMR